MNPLIITTILLSLFFVLLLISYIDIKLKEKFYKESIEKKTELIESYKKTNLKNEQIIKENNKINNNKINSYINLIKLFINTESSIIVYTHSNFYKNFSFYNKRYYAKINNNSTNNKAEAIPFLQLKGKTNLVLDLYKLNSLYKENMDIETFNIIVNQCWISKEEVIKSLGNKILKTYNRK